MTAHVKVTVGGVAYEGDIPEVIVPPIPIPPAEFPAVPIAGFVGLELIPEASGKFGFSFGHHFVNGDVLRGTKLQGLQLTGKNYHADGSVDFGIVSGGCEVSSGVSRVVGLMIGSGPSGRDLTIEDLKATGAIASISCGAFGTERWAGDDWDAPFLVWDSGPLKSTFIYRRPIGKDPHLVGWIRVNVWRNGEASALPWIEAGYLLVPDPTSKAATFAFTFGTTERCSVAIDLPAHTGTPLIDGTELEYRLGADPAFDVVHDRTYQRRTKKFPPYSAKVTAAAATATGCVTEKFSPLKASGYRYSNDDMESPGFQWPIGPMSTHDMLHFVTERGMYKSVVRSAYSARRYPICYRKDGTGELVDIRNHPHLVLREHTGFKDTGGSTTGEYTPAVSGTSAPGIDPAHEPSYGCTAYWLTGDFYHMQTAQMAAIAEALWSSDGPDSRNGADALFRPVPGAVQTRAAGWRARNLAQAVAVTPDADGDPYGLLASLKANIVNYHDTYIAQPNNPWGCVEMDYDYGTNDSRYVGASWMQDFHSCSIGYLRALNLWRLGPEAIQKLAEFHDWHARFSVMRAGDHSADSWQFENAAPYRMTISPSKTPDWRGGKGPWYKTAREMYEDTKLYANGMTFSTVDGMLASDVVPFTIGFLANYIPALAYAVEFNVPGAAEGWKRLTTALNYQQELAVPFNQIPTWSVEPASGLPTPPVIGLPAYFTGKAVMECFQIPGTTLAGSEVLPMFTPGNTAANSNIVYSTFSRKDSELIFPGPGGHNDWSGNAVFSINMKSDAPKWNLRRAATADPTPNAPYNVSDGSRTTAHLYNNSHWNAARNRLISHGHFGLWPIGSTLNTDGFNLETNQWDPAGTWKDAAVAAQCQDKDGNVWGNGNYFQLWKWTEKTDTWNMTGQFGGQVLRVMANDFLRDVRFQFTVADDSGSPGVIAAYRYDAAGTTQTQITFNDSDGVSALLATPQMPNYGTSYSGLVYDEKNDCFWLWFGMLYPAPLLVKIIPNAGTKWDMSIPKINGTPPANALGAYSRMEHLPELDALVFMPDAASDMSAMRTA